MEKLTEKNYWKYIKMIIKVDHIAFNSVDESELDIFKDKGFKLTFYEKNLRNLDSKLLLMKNRSKFHDLFYLESENSTPIEVLIYNKVVDFERYRYELKDNLVSYEVHSIKESIKFWISIGFKLIEEHKGEAVLTFCGIFDAKALTIKLIESIDCVTVGNYCIDSKGYSCIAFISNKIEKEHFRLRNEGCFVTDIESLKVNCKDLSIFFVKGPNSEIVEIIRVNS